MDVVEFGEHGRLICGDAMEVLPTLEGVDAVVTDPPYGLEFMGEKWDSFPLRDRGVRLTGNGSPTTARGFGGNVAYGKSLAATRQFGEWCESWAPATLNAMKPGAYLLAFGGTRTYHRLACAIEDAGFEIRDCIIWLYGSGFPKHKACLKPAYEPIIVARKPGSRSTPLNVDECRAPCGERPRILSKPKNGSFAGVFREGSSSDGTTDAGRWPANVVHDGSDEVMEAFAEYGDSKSSNHQSVRRTALGMMNDDSWEPQDTIRSGFTDTGTAARFFYCAKASKDDRDPGNTHPTVKPVELMRWLVRLVTPKGGTVLDPFAGSGSTLIAAFMENRKFIGTEISREYFDIAVKRVTHCLKPGMFSEVV